MRVLITRGGEEAQPYAQAVRDRGHDAILCPLFAIEPTTVSLPDLSTIDALVFTSAHGLRQFCALSPRRDLPVYVVGPQTAHEAQRQGFGEVRCGPGDAAGLAAQVAEPGGRILYGRGEETAFPLAETLGAAGCAVSEIVLYRARAVKALPALGHFDAALFFSRRGVEIFHDIVEKQGLNANFSQIKALCLGEGMVEFLTLQGWQDIAVASSPDRHGMLTLMDTIL